MKKYLFVSLCLSIWFYSSGQEVGGCVSYLADNYSPEATYNDGTCDYNLQQLLLDGASLGDLVFSGVLESEIVGLFAAGGVVADVDEENSRALIAGALSSFEWDGDGYYYAYNINADEMLDTDISTDIYSGESNSHKYITSYLKRSGSDGYGPNNYFDFARYFAQLGYYDWYVPSKGDMEAYIDMLDLVNYYGYIQWPIDPNGGSASYTLQVPPYYLYGYQSSYSLYAYLTSSFVNAGEDGGVLDGYVFMRGEDPYNWEGYNTYSYLEGTTEYHPSNWTSGIIQGSANQLECGSNYSLSFIPMRTEILQPPATTNSCTDWQYGDAGNQAITAGVPCLYPLFQCDSVESTIWDELVIGAYPANTTVVEYGRDDTRDVLINIPSTHEIDDNIYEVVHYEVTGISDVPVGLDVNLLVGDSIEGGDVHCLDFSGTALAEGIYTVTIDGILRMDILGSVLQVDITMTHVIAVIPNVTGIEGCVYTSADNYDPLATIDDGTCTFGGLCPGDFDGDDLIGVTDILYLLGIYNSSCE